MYYSNPQGLFKNLNDSNLFYAELKLFIWPRQCAQQMTFKGNEISEVLKIDIRTKLDI